MIKIMTQTLALLVGVAACSDGKVNQAENSSVSIYNGQEASDPTKVGVFYIYGGCTGVLVAKGKLLTAGHCFFASSDDPVNKNVHYEALGQDFRINRIVKSAFKTVNQLNLSLTDYNVPAFDLALVEFDDRDAIPDDHILPIVKKDFDAGFMPFRVEGTVAGYGWVDDNLNNVDPGKQVPRRLRQGSMYWVSKWGVHNQELYLSGPSNICSGDSGGPFFVNMNNRRYLAGINIASTNFYLERTCGVDNSIATSLGHGAVREWVARVSNNSIKIN